MLFNDRNVHYILGYPVEARYNVQKIDRGNDILYFPIAETSTLYTVGQVGCPDTSWGRKITQEVDKVLLLQRSSETFLNFYESWLNEETAKTYRKLATDFFDQDRMATPTN